MFLSQLALLFSALLLGLTSVTAAPLFTPDRSASSMDKRFSGRGTYYEVGLGACGQRNSNSEPIIALNSNQYKKSACGKWITITSNGKTAKGIVRDMCPGCGFGGLDLSPSLFKKFGPLSRGVINLSWSLGGSSKRSNDATFDETASLDDPDFEFDPEMELKAEDLFGDDDDNTLAT